MRAAPVREPRAVKIARSALKVTSVVVTAWHVRVRTVHISDPLPEVARRARVVRVVHEHEAKTMGRARRGRVELAMMVRHGVELGQELLLGQAAAYHVAARHVPSRRCRNTASDHLPMAQGRLDDHHSGVDHELAIPLQGIVGHGAKVGQALVEEAVCELREQHVRVQKRRTARKSQPPHVKLGEDFGPPFVGGGPRRRDRLYRDHAASDSREAVANVPSGRIA